MPVPMAPPQEQTTPTAKNASPQRSQVESKWGRRFGGVVFLGLAIALHSLAFVVPWPESEVVEEPEPEVVLEPDPPAISISRLPPVAPDPEAKAAETTEKSTLPNRASQPPERQTPAPPATPPPKPEAEAEAETPEIPPPDTSVLPEDNGLPLSSGEEPITVPPLPTELAQQLLDPSAYVKDGDPVDSFRVFTSKAPDWMNEVSTQLGFSPLPVLNNPLQFSIDYALDNCQSPLDPLPEKGTLGVVLSESGEVLAGPEVLGTSGYSLFDRQAKEKAIEEAISNLPSRSEPALYTLEFEVLYENCP